MRDGSFQVIVERRSVTVSFVRGSVIRIRVKDALLVSLILAFLERDRDTVDVEIDQWKMKNERKRDKVKEWTMCVNAPIRAGERKKTYVSLSDYREKLISDLSSSPCPPPHTRT